MYFVNTSLGVKDNETLKALLLLCMKYTALGESLVTSIALGFALCHIYLPLDIQTGSSALSNKYRSQVHIRLLGAC